jgi:hypothetical protein
MHVTQPQGGLCPAPIGTASGQPESSASTLAGILLNPVRFRAHIAAQLAATVRPADTTDVDGSYTLTDAGHAALDEAPATGAPGTAAPVLRSAALYLERHGWIQGCYYDATSGSFTPPACLVGAIGMACYGGPVDAPAQHFDDPGFLDFEEAVLHLDRYLLVHDGSESYDFNDAKGRQVADVLHVLRQAADTPADELIDAIRAIDQKNADIAAIAQQLTPSGIWAGTVTPGELEHADYPHSPGTLYDCPACELACACSDGFVCVRCSIRAEWFGTARHGGDTA